VAKPNPINIEAKPEANVATSRKANWWLIALGVLLVAIFVGGVWYSRGEGSETVEKSSPVKPGQAEATEKTTMTKDVPSETLLTAVLSTGAALIIVGALYGRISTIKLPGGVEVSMSEEAEEKTVKKAVEEHPGAPEKAAAVAQKAQALLLQEAAVPTATPPDGKIEEAVKLASTIV